MPAFGKVPLGAIDHAGVSAWFDAASVEKPGAANRAFEILRAMLRTARQWGEIGECVPDACANIVRNPRRPVARFLDRGELQRLGAVLDARKAEQPWPAAAIRLLVLTGARLSEILNLKWDEIGQLGEDGASARLEDSKTGPRTTWLGPEAASVLAALPRAEDATRVFPEYLTSSRLYTFWVSVREEAELPGFRIHNCRHTWASQGIMNGVGLTTVGRLLGHRQRDTTAIYAHLDEATLGDAAAHAATIIASAMRYTPRVSLAPGDTRATGSHEKRDGTGRANQWTAPAGQRYESNEPGPKCKSPKVTGEQGSTTARPHCPDIDWLAADRFGADSEPGCDN